MLPNAYDILYSLGLVISSPIWLIKPAARKKVLTALRERMGHAWQGFTESQISDWAGDAGFSATNFAALPAHPSAKGPSLFVASCVA